MQKLLMCPLLEDSGRLLGRKIAQFCTFFSKIRFSLQMRHVELYKILDNFSALTFLVEFFQAEIYPYFSSRPIFIPAA